MPTKIKRPRKTKSASRNPVTPKKKVDPAPISFLDIAKMHEHLTGMDRDTALALDAVVKVLQPLSSDMQQRVLAAVKDIMY